MKSPTITPVTLASSPSEASSLLEIPSLEGVSTPNLTRCVAWLGITLSVGTIGLLGESAVAANNPANTLEYLPTVPSPVAEKPETPETALTVPSLKHEVKEGESLWALAENYKLDPETLAKSNQLSPKAELTVGQTLKIPSLEPTVPQPTPLPVALGTPNVNAPAPIAPVEEKSAASEQQIKETRQRLAQTWTELKTEQKTNQEVKIAAEVSDVSEPTPEISPSQKNLTSLIPSDAQSIPIEVIGVDEAEISPNTLENQAIPIPVPTPESQQRAFVPPSESLLLPTSEDVIEIDPYKEPEVSAPIEQNFPQTPPSVEKAYLPRPVDPTPTPIIPQPTINTPVIKQTHQVQAGDTVNSIARRYGITASELIQANGISNPNLIKANQTLVIPKALDARKAQESARLADLPFPQPVTPSRSVEVPIAALPTEQFKMDLVKVAPDYQPTQEQAIAIEVDYPSESQRTVVGAAINPEWQRNQGNKPESLNFESSETETLIGTATSTQEATNRFQIPIGETVSPELPALTFPDDYLPDAPMRFTGYIWPAKGVLTSGYGRRWGRMHKGIDIAAPIGTPIVAAAEGEVVSAGWNSGGYGNLVKVRHGDGSITLYAHNSKILVRPGQQVDQGQLIAKMGSTGFSTGPHLHFEVHPSGQGARNPMAFLPKSR